MSYDPTTVDYNAGEDETAIAHVGLPIEGDDTAWVTVQMIYDRSAPENTPLRFYVHIHDDWQTVSWKIPCTPADLLHIGQQFTRAGTRMLEEGVFLHEYEPRETSSP